MGPWYIGSTPRLQRGEASSILAGSTMKKVFVTLIVLALLSITFLGVGGFYVYNNKKLVVDIKINEKSGLIVVDYPKPNQVIASPLLVTGKARGYWFFEASFPVVLVNWDGLIIADGIATAKADWMTEDFVPFEAKLNFTVDKNAYSNKGALILKKDNPSGLPANNDSVEIPVNFY